MQKPPHYAIFKLMGDDWVEMCKTFMLNGI